MACHPECFNLTPLLLGELGIFFCQRNTKLGFQFHPPYLKGVPLSDKEGETPSVALIT